MKMEGLVLGFLFVAGLVTPARSEDFKIGDRCMDLSRVQFFPQDEEIYYEIVYCDDFTEVTQEIYRTGLRECQAVLAKPPRSWMHVYKMDGRRREIEVVHSGGDEYQFAVRACREALR